MKLPEQLIDDDSFEIIKHETYGLIRRFCNKIKLSEEHKYKLFLHDSTPIEFTQYTPEDIDRFYADVQKYCSGFIYLIQHLSYEAETQPIETDQVIGNIDFERTRVLHQTNKKKLVCIVYTKNLFTPENVLLGALILGINELARKFLGVYDEWREHDDDGRLEKRLHEIIHYTSFLQRDRFVSKLINYYYRNFEGIEPLLEKISYRMTMEKIKDQYKPLIKFISIWKDWNKILQEEKNSLEANFPGLEQFNRPEKVYEIWVFFKTLQMLSEDELGGKIHQKPSPAESHCFSNDIFTIEYQYNQNIGWQREDTGTEIRRLPDTVIKRNGSIIATLDAKYRPASQTDDESEDADPDMPATGIVNQMLIAMDYGDRKDTTDLGIVLFADDREKDHHLVIKETQGQKKIHFVNMHPKNNLDAAMEYVKKLIVFRK